MAREKKTIHIVQMTDGKRNIIRQLLAEHDIKSVKVCGTLKIIMKAEMDEHLGYSKSEHSGNDNCCNGYKTKQVNISCRSMKIGVPQDRKSAFEPDDV